jgi:ribosomal 30S subunit maturation factor RimM
MNNDESIELPFVEAFFPEVDIENKTIVMIDPEVV